MIFTVPKKFKGSFVLNTLNRALSKGMTVSISGNKLYAADIKMAIAAGILVPVGDEYGEDQIGVSHDVVLVNKTDRVMVLGETVLNPNGSLLVSKDALGDTAIKAAIKNGFIGIISKDAPVKKIVKKKVTKKKVSKKKEVEEEVFDEETDQFVYGAERQVQAKVWNFREQESVDAQLVPKTPDMISVDEEEEEDVDFVDEPLEVQKVSAKKKKVTKKTKKKTKKKAVKKAKKKKAVKKTIKKKGKATKKRKVKALEPVGDKRIPKTQMDAAIELDSRGRPLENASDALNHLIDSVDTGEVSFVDDEQAQKRYNDRTDMD